MEHSRQVLQKLKQMQQLVENTLIQVNKIVEETDRQKSVTGEVENSFHQVNHVSDDLMKISQA